MLDLLGRHRHVHEKVGPGVRALLVQKEYRGTQHFSIERVDGTIEDFSFRSCITPRTPETELRMACRTAVVDSVQCFKLAAFSGHLELACPISGEPVSIATAHVDHAPPWTFDAIVQAFVSAHGNPYVPPSGGVTTRFARARRRTRFPRIPRRARILQDRLAEGQPLDAEARHIVTSGPAIRSGPDRAYWTVNVLAKIDCAGKVPYAWPPRNGASSK